MPVVGLDNLQPCFLLPNILTGSNEWSSTNIFGQRFLRNRISNKKTAIVMAVPLVNVPLLTNTD